MVRFSVLLIATLLGHSADAGCRQALAVGMDVSGRVDADEYTLQRQGLARALLDPAVQDAFLFDPNNPVRLMIFEWSGANHQRVLLPWTSMVDETVLDDTSRIIRLAPRIDAPPTTAIGAAIAFGARELAQHEDCWQTTLDISGDGKRNTGPSPSQVLQMPGLAHLTVNGLVILNGDTPRNHAEHGELTAYYHAEVLHGPLSFLEVATDFNDFERAMTQKLIQELAPAAISMRQTGQSLSHQ